MRSTELLCHCWSNGYKLHLNESKNCVVNGVATAFNYTCAKHRIAFSLVEQRLSITNVVRSTGFRFHWFSNGIQIHLCETQECVFTGGAKAFNYTCCAIHRIALSLVEQRLSITLLRKRIALSLVAQRLPNYICAKQSLLFIGGATAFNYPFCVKHTIAFSELEQMISITLVQKENSVVTGVQRLSIKLVVRNRIAFSMAERRLSITLVRSTELLCHWCCNGLHLHLM